MIDYYLGDILRDGTDRNQALPATTLLIRRGKDLILLPPDDFPLAPGDELLLAGTRDALNDIGLIIANEHTLAYILSGEDLPGGWVWERLARRKQAPVHARLP